MSSNGISQTAPSTSLLPAGAKGRVVIEYSVSADGQCVTVRINDGPARQVPVAHFQAFGPIVQALVSRLGAGQ